MRGGCNYQTVEQKPATVSFRLIAYDHLYLSLWDYDHHEDNDDLEDHNNHDNNDNSDSNGRYNYQIVEQKPTNVIGIMTIMRIMTITMMITRMIGEKIIRQWSQNQPRSASS